MTNDLLLSTEGPMGYPIRPRGAITMHVAYTGASRQALLYIVYCVRGPSS